jgi:hypothetical protein
MREITNLYETDFYEWSHVQADHIKNKRFSEIDIENIAEEIDSLGISNKTTLRSQLNRLLMHLLKEKYQPEKNFSNSWRSYIVDAKREILYITDHSPSLKNFLLTIFSKSYKDARKYASDETSLDIKKFPEECPWDFYELFPDLKGK